VTEQAFNHPRTIGLMQFHPAVSGWLAGRFGQPTEVQSGGMATASAPMIGGRRRFGPMLAGGAWVVSCEVGSMTTTNWPT